MKPVLKLLFAVALTALPALAAEEPIPKLRPPRGEWHPAFWEQHGWLISAATPLVLFAGWCLVRLLRHPLPIPDPPVAVVARRELEALAALPEDASLVVQVSRILRGYLASVFPLAAGELTTSEVRRALEGLPRIGPELTRATVDFLTRCDELKFASAQTVWPQPGTGASPESSPPRHRPVAAEALELIERHEAHRRSLDPAQRRSAPHHEAE